MSPWDFQIYSQILRYRNHVDVCARNLEKYHLSRESPIMFSENIKVSWRKSGTEIILQHAPYSNEPERKTAFQPEYLRNHNILYTFPMFWEHFKSASFQFAFWGNIFFSTLKFFFFFLTWVWSVWKVLSLDSRYLFVYISVPNRLGCVRKNVIQVIFSV